MQVGSISGYTKPCCAAVDGQPRNRHLSVNRETDIYQSTAKPTFIRDRVKICYHSHYKNGRFRVFGGKHSFRS
jgi:hypothetical protein